MITHGLRRSLALLVALALTGCATMDPYRGSENIAVATNPTMQGAVGYAVGLRGEYYSAMSESSILNRGTGIVLTAIAAAGAAIGISGGSTDVLTGLGVGGAGIFGISRLLHSKPRMQIYAEGARAITCTLAVFEPVRTLDLEALEREAEELAEEADALRTLLDGVPAGPLQDLAEVVAARAELRESDASLDVARSFDTAAVRLIDSVDAVRGEVNKALIADEPDLNELVANLGQTIPINANLLVGRDLVAAQAKPAAPKARVSDPAMRRRLAEIDAQTDQVKRARRTLDRRIGGAKGLPSTADLVPCAFQDTGGFRTDPRFDVVIAPSSSGVVIASGGTPPYHARWVGQLPGTDLTLDPIDHDAGGPKRGIITIKAAAAASTATTYKLLVTDEGTGSATLLVTVQGKRSGTTTSTTTTTTSTAPTPDPEVLKIQTELTRLGCFDGVASIDGVWGPVTEAATEKFATPLGASVHDMFGVPGTDDFETRLLDTLKDSSPPCVPVPAPVPAPEGAEPAPPA